VPFTPLGVRFVHRGLFYLARMLSEQLVSGEDYRELRASVGVHFSIVSLSDAMIAMATGLSETEVVALRGLPSQEE
jgi:hypothetical protein